MLKQRIVTALVLALLVGGGVLWLPTTGLSLLFAAAVLISAWEYAQLAGFTAVTVRCAYVAACAGLLGLLAWQLQLFGDIELARLRDVLGLACLWWSLALLWVMGYPGSARLWGSRPLRALMGLLTLLPSWLALSWLRLHEHGIALIFLLVAIVASADIGAYFAGRRWGRAKLAVAVSPGKSWAGFWGGLVCSVSLVLALYLWLQPAPPLAGVLALTLITALASVLGDLVESMVKRHQGVKDSGTVLPGHGGMMDRLDSLTAAAPVFALGILLTGW